MKENFSQAFCILKQFHENLNPEREQLKYWNSRIGNPSLQRLAIMSMNVGDKKKAISMLRKEPIDTEGRDGMYKLHGNIFQRVQDGRKSSI